jgi:hypothetical protein
VENAVLGMCAECWLGWVGDPLMSLLIETPPSVIRAPFRLSPGPILGDLTDRWPHLKTGPKTPLFGAQARSVASLARGK